MTLTREQIEADALGHVWTEFGNLIMCMNCGWLKKGKKAQQECKGNLGISLREGNRK